MIPPKPRKIKRVSLLFESKLKLLKDISYDVNLVAKITLLELFSPKILRFIQNYDYAETYRVLFDFNNIKNKTKTMNNDTDLMDDIVQKNMITKTLYDSTRIEEFIDRHIDYTKEKQIRYKKLLVVLNEHNNSRTRFDLSSIFDVRESYDALKIAIECREPIKIVRKKE